jgi:hypothetical protein
VDPTQPTTERRRSERVVESVPIVVRGVDLLGQPFEERTATLVFNFHGCRYASRHHLPRNSWVTLELKHGAEVQNVRARVASVHRPHSVRERFQVSVELESPANIWGGDPSAADRGMAEAASYSPADDSKRDNPRSKREFSTAEPAVADYFEPLKADMTNTHSDLESPMPVEPPAASMAENPLLRQLSSFLEARAKEEVERAATEASEQIHRTADECNQKHAAWTEDFFRTWREQFEAAHSSEREEFSAELAARQSGFLSELKSNFEENFDRARHLADDLERRAQMLHAEKEAALELTSRVAEARLQMEAAEAVRASQPLAEASLSIEEVAATQAAAADWRKRLDSEMSIAQRQWNELLQSSLDSGTLRLAEQLAERSQEVLSNSEQKFSERFAEVRQSIAQLISDSRETLAGLKQALEEKLGSARSSLTGIEQSASRMKEYSAQLEAASHETLNELHHRLEKILEAQTDEMNRRIDALAASASQRVAPMLDTLGGKFVERTISETESKLAPHLERATGLLRELAAREVQAEESLRLHRERLRQASENNQREVAAQMGATLADLHVDFESARMEALTKWTEELNASGVRASHAAAESVARSSEWAQKEASARLDALVEQKLADAGTGYDEKIAEATQNFGGHLDEHASAHLAQVRDQLDRLGGEFVAQTRTEFEAAAEAAAASFGHVLHGISELAAQQFESTSSGVARKREQELGQTVKQALEKLDSEAAELLERLRAKMASQVDASVAEGRQTLAADFASDLDRYRAEHNAWHAAWAEDLNRLSNEGAVKHQERLDAMCDSWMTSSVRRLNEHGQNVIEALMRSADQAMRESCSKLFEGLAEMLRDRTANAANAVCAAGFAAGQGHEAPETPSPSHAPASCANA